ncbi:hypothetical protein OIU78_019370 [Salix suchowensis]|nr:hypothetical protein OIU78_019370 [Salix suchowensis]
MDAANSNQHQPDVDQVLDRYLAETERVSNNFPSLIKNNIENQLANKKEHVESLKRLEKEQAVAKMIGSMNNFNGGGFWWDLPIDNMEQDELEAYKESMEELKKNLIARLGLIESTCNALNVDQVLDRYLAETERVPNNFPSLIKNNVENQLANKQEYAESLKRLEEEQTVAKMIGSMNNMNGGGFWWDLPIDNMEQDELEAYRESMEELKKNLIARLGLIESTCNALSESRIANPFINLKEIPSSLSFNSHQCQ